MVRISPTIVRTNEQTIVVMMWALFSILQSGIQSDSQGKRGVGLRNRSGCLESRAGAQRCGARSSDQ